MTSRYKIVENTSRYNDKIYKKYYIMKEVKKWYRSKPIWVYCKEYSYSGYIKKYTNNLTDAEAYIKNMIYADNIELTSNDVKIYECRVSKIDKLLNN